MTDLCFLPATTLTQLIADRQVSSQEVMEAQLEAIDRVNPTLNAIVTLVPDEAREQALKADAALARGDRVGPLHGLPVAHKDLVPTKGIRTTFGSKVFEHFVPDEDALVYCPRVLGQWFDGIRFYAAASSPRRSRRTWAGLR